MTYQCSDGNCPKPVAEILTSLRDGSSDAACADDLPIMYIGHLAIALEVDPQRLYDAIQRFTVAEAKREAKAQAAQQPAKVTVDDPKAGPFNGGKLMGAPEVLADAHGQADAHGSEGEQA